MIRANAIALQPERVYVCDRVFDCLQGVGQAGVGHGQTQVVRQALQKSDIPFGKIPRFKMVEPQCTDHASSEFYRQGYDGTDPFRFCGLRVL